MYYLYVLIFLALDGYLCSQCFLFDLLLIYARFSTKYLGHSSAPSVG